MREIYYWKQYQRQYCNTHRSNILYPFKFVKNANLNIFQDDFYKKKIIVKGHYYLYFPRPIQCGTRACNDSRVMSLWSDPFVIDQFNEKNQKRWLSMKKINQAKFSSQFFFFSKQKNTWKYKKCHLFWWEWLSLYSIQTVVGNSCILK